MVVIQDTIIKYVYLKFSYNFTMMMESIFSFLPCHLTSLATKKSKVKSVNLLVFLAVTSYRAKTVLVNQIAGFQIKYISRTK